MTDDVSRWPLPWVRALLEPAILGVLSAGPGHGYAIAASLEAAGLGRLKGGSLYPVLARLEERGDVTTTWTPGESGPGRRSYTLTEQGTARLADDLAALGGLQATLVRLATEGER